MTPATVTPLAGIEQILLIVFVLMILVGIAGGNPSMVLKPLFDILTQLVSMLLGLISTLVATLFQTLLSLLVSIVQALSTLTQSTTSHHINH